MDNRIGHRTILQTNSSLPIAVAGLNSVPIPSDSKTKQKKQRKQGARCLPLLSPLASVSAASALADSCLESSNSHTVEAPRRSSGTL
jgi:hypothetical protein